MTDDQRSAELVDIEAQAKRAGLTLTPQELADLVEPYRRTREALQALRADLASTEEPALTFDPR
jgi:hypothetical protein